MSGWGSLPAQYRFTIGVHRDHFKGPVSRYIIGHVSLKGPTDYKMLCSFSETA